MSIIRFNSGDLEGKKLFKDGDYIEVIEYRGGGAYRCLVEELVIDEDDSESFKASERLLTIADLKGAEVL